MEIQEHSSHALIADLCQAIYNKKGKNILALDLRGISTMTDFFLIAEGSVERHVKALANAILDALHQYQIEPLHVEGTSTADWIVIDLGNIVIHLFTPDLRQKYALEELWHDGTIVDVPITLQSRGENE